MTDLTRLTAAETAAAIAAKEVSAVEVAQAHLDRIAAVDGAVHAFLHVDAEGALAQAAGVDRGELSGPLAGVPLAMKDIVVTKDVPTTVGSRILEGWRPPYDSTINRRLREAGVVVLGKTNLDEFAMGSSTEHSAYGPTHNPWDLDRIPGGSGGGSAAALAAYEAPLAVGTDTGGSIRQPASLCGVTGIKPTYGRVSRYGMVAFASSLDQGGPITQTAEDAALMLNAMAGFDARDSTSAERPDEDYTADLDAPLHGLRIGLPREFSGGGLDPGVARVIEAAIKELEALGARGIEIDLPNTPLSIPVYYVVAPAECSSNLARFDGVRFGYRCAAPADLHDLYCRSRGEGFGAEVKRRIMIGTYALSAGYYDAYYLKAQQIRRLIRDDYRRAFERVDVIMGPTSPSVAFKLGEKTGDPITMYLSDIYTISVNLAGLPGMSIPAGFAEGLPVGLQLIGKHFGEARLLNIAHRYQQVTDWHRRTPPGID